MITTVWPYLAIMLLAAGLFPTLEHATRARVFEVLPPIVLTYLFVTALAVAGTWVPTDEITTAQRALAAQVLPALLFLLMVTCDLRAILALGPRVLAVFACAMGAILVAIVLGFLMFRHVLPADGWKMLAALSATWTGGSANLVAVKQMIGLSETALPPVLLADALCYSVWVVVLFSSAGFAKRFDTWTRSSTSLPVAHAEAQIHAPRSDVASVPGIEPDHRTAPLSGTEPDPRTASHSGTDHDTGFAPLSRRDELGKRGSSPGEILLWLGIAVTVGLAAARAAQHMPSSNMFTPTSWTVLFATLAGLVAARTPLARIPGPGPLASALLALLVAVLASQSNFAGMADAPLFVLVGFVVLTLHIALLALAAKLFRFELHLVGIASLAQIGGAASAPLLAATYNRVLVPVAVLLAMLGLVLGTGVGMAMATLLSALAPVAP